MKSFLLMLVPAILTLQTMSAPSQLGQVSPVPLTAAQCKCSIEVMVKRSDTGAPISDADVSAVPGGGVGARGAATRAAAASAAFSKGITDSAGNAVLRDLAEGIYVVHVQHDGYFGPMQNGDALPEVTATVRVGPASNTLPTVNASQSARGTSPAGSNPANSTQLVQQVVITLIPGGGISGRIFGVNGRPVSRVQVGAIHVTYVNGQPTLAQSRGTMVQTDDRGDYRLFGIAPGEYYVRTENGGQAQRGQAIAYSKVTYYPGTIDSSMAVAVSVRAGQEINGEDFTLQPASGVTVSGTVINNLPGGMVLANGQLSREISSLYLVRRNPNFNEVPQSFPNILGMAGGVVLDAGTNFPFEIRDVLPGTYDLYPIFAVGLGIGARGLASPSPSYYTGRTLVEVGSENVTNVRAVIRPGVDLKGHISVIGFPPNSQSPETDPVKNIRVRIVPLDNRPSQLNNSAFVTPLDNDGTFTLTNLIDARYRIASIEGLPYGTYVSDIRLGMRSLYDEGIFEIGKETPDSLEITLKYGNAAIGGAVLDAQHNPAVSARVILIPDAPRRQNFILYGSATTNAAGRFAIYDIAPGSYKLFAWENLPTSAEKNPKFIREYEGRGVSMTISPGTTMTNLQVPLILDEQH